MPAEHPFTALIAAIAMEAAEAAESKADEASFALAFLESDLRSSEPPATTSSAWNDSMIYRVAQARLGFWHLNNRSMSRALASSASQPAP